MNRRSTGTPRSTGTKRRRKNRRVAGQGPVLHKRVPKRLLSACLGVIALIGATVAIKYGWASLVEAERLRINSIEIEGNHRATKREILAYTGARVGDPILAADLDAMSLGLRRHPWIDNARVRRRLPHQLFIEIEEHQAQLLVGVDQVYVADDEGRLFKRLSTADGLVLPVLTGLDRAEVGRQSERSAEIVREGIALLRSLENTSLGRVEELNWDGVLGWAVVTKPGHSKGAHLRVNLGRDAVSRIGLAARAFEGLQAQGRNPQILWVDGTKKNNRVHARLRQAVGQADSQPLLAKVGD